MVPVSLRQAQQVPCCFVGFCFARKICDCRGCSRLVWNSSPIRLLQMACAKVVSGGLAPSTDAGRPGSAIMCQRLQRFRLRFPSLAAIRWTKQAWRTPDRNLPSQRRVLLARAPMARLGSAMIRWKLRPQTRFALVPRHPQVQPRRHRQGLQLPRRRLAEAMLLARTMAGRRMPSSTGVPPGSAS